MSLATLLGDAALRGIMDLRVRVAWHGVADLSSDSF